MRRTVLADLDTILKAGGLGSFLTMMATGNQPGCTGLFLTG